MKTKHHDPNLQQEKTNVSNIKLKSGDHVSKSQHLDSTNQTGNTRDYAPQLRRFNFKNKSKLFHILCVTMY